MYDVARKAGVSPMTVSRVINGHPLVSVSTREKVMRAVADLDYQVNMAARVARVGPVCVGLLCSNPSAAYLSALLVGALDQCGRSGAELIMEDCEESGSQRTAIDKLIARGADGIIVSPPLCDSTAALQHLKQIGMPTVAVATARPAPQVSAVRIDDYQGALAMTNYLLSLGHTEIGFIKGDPEHTPAQLRCQAFMDAMRAAGLAVPAARVAHGMFTYRSGLAAGRELLSQPDPPTAIFASNDDMAAAVVAVAHGMGLRLPEDLAICGFDDTPVASTVWPQLTTIHQPIPDMGRQAVELLLEHIRERRAGHLVSPQQRLLPFRLVARKSAGGEQ